MNNEIQLSSLGNALPMQQAPGGGALGGYYGGGPAAPQEAGPLRKLHRLLRGRYLLAFILGLFGAAAGAVGGYLSQKPAHKADGMIQIKPIIVSPGTTGGSSNSSDKILSMFSAYVNEQMQRIQSDTVVRQAMEDPRWKAVRPGPVTDSSVADFTEKLTVSLPPRSNTIIMISYSDNSPDSKKVVSAAAQSLVTAYISLYGKEDVIKAGERVSYWKGQCDAVDRDIQAKQVLIQETSKITDGDPSVLRKYEEQLFDLEKSVQQTKLDLQSLKQQLSSSNRRQTTPEDWGRVDPAMNLKIKMRDDLQLVVRALIVQLGENHPSVQNRSKELNIVKEEVAAYAQALDEKFIIMWKSDGAGGTVLSKDTAILEQRIADGTVQIGEQRKRVEAIRQAAAKIAALKAEIDQLNIRGAEAASARREWEFKRDSQALLSVLNDGRVARVDKDRRPIFAAIGFMGGAGLPIGLLLLFGFFDTRYRYSDETAASGATMGGLTLLGILPNLPDRLSDPEQAAIAAHCVHQIRTMLQINTGLEDRRVFAVTSASPGDGKTSLTLALGLSYAACGTRTLLIDCDLIGSGLSSRMNVSAEGVLEAIVNRSLLPFVRQTDVNDVSILPVGSTGNLHASTLSPQALRRLIEEAEQHFEVVLIDTGPILGSIEASLVCAAADAVILAVSRGQQRPMVEKSLGHLAAIGARLAGVVFNRAQAQDFERSISGVSMRSVGVQGLPRGARPAGPRLGPVARAMQGNGAPMQGTDDGQPPVQ